MKTALIATGLGIAIVGLVAWFVMGHPSTPATPASGVPLALAQERASRVSDLRYVVRFDIPARRGDPVRGRLTASFTLHGASRPLAFDFAQPTDHLLSVTANQHRLNALVQNGHVVIPRRSLDDGRNEIVFEFLAGDAPLNRNDDFLYTLFVPARASLAMPCFDQPDVKARWTLTLNVPAGWTAVSNGAETGRTGAAQGTRISFAETQPIPPYLFAFAAGRFQVETAVRDGRTFRMFHRETDAAKVARNRDAIFDLHAHALAWMENYTGIPYPFGKFDFVLIPAFQFGGMEHPGAIYYNASSLMLDQSATQNQLLNRAETIAHETSHMWFGDLVTMKWFDDVWMKEVFANFMAGKIVEPSFPGVNHQLRFLYDNYPAAYGIDRTPGANPIRQPLANLDEAGSLYGAIIYNKAPIVMRQLEAILGATGLRDGLRDYLKQYAMGNASWTDLVRLLDARTPVDLSAWSHAWVDEPGRPTVRVEPQVENGRFDRVVLEEADPLKRGLVWPEALTLVFGGRGFDAAS